MHASKQASLGFSLSALYCVVVKANGTIHFRRLAKMMFNLLRLSTTLVRSQNQMESYEVKVESKRQREIDANGKVRLDKPQVLEEEEEAFKSPPLCLPSPS